MNIKEALAMMQKLDPVGFQKLDQQITGHLTTAGASLTLEQIMFVKANISALPEWLKTPEGKVAVQTFVQDWEASFKEGALK